MEKNAPYRCREEILRRISFLQRQGCDFRAQRGGEQQRAVPRTPRFSAARSKFILFWGGTGVGRSERPISLWAPSNPFGRLRYQGPPTCGASQGPRPLPAKPMTKGSTHPTMRSPEDTILEILSSSPSRIGEPQAAYPHLWRLRATSPKAGRLAINPPQLSDTRIAEAPGQPCHFRVPPIPSWVRFHLQIKRYLPPGRYSPHVSSL